MNTLNIVLPNRYYDSVVLMNSAGKVKEHTGAEQASLMMGTDANKDIMRATNLLTPDGEKAQPGDLIVALVGGDPGSVEELSAFIEEVLAPKGQVESDEYFPRSLGGATDMLSGANLALLSIPGEYVEWESEKILDRGLHLMLFSDNVPLDAEIRLKKKGEQKGLLVMGPDCGTSIINGVALAFANVIRRGEIGIVAAAGTGIQEVTTLIHKMGGGITHAIGTGGRDLSKDVGGITMKMGIRMLIDDPSTKVLVLVSKPPHPDVEKEIYELLKGVKKPVIINFLGSDGVDAQKMGFKFAETMERAAVLAVEATGKEAHLPDPENLDSIIDRNIAKLKPEQKFLRGLYSGGTLGNETRIIIENMGIGIYSNLTKDPAWKMKNPMKSEENTLVDMGDDVFTKGTPHPMIDNTKRIERLLKEAKDPGVAIILMDVVLGYGSHPDPASELAPAINKAREIAGKDGRHLIFIGSVCGVNEDPQDARVQVEALRREGMILFPSNARASKFAGELLKKINRS